MADLAAELDDVMAETDAAEDPRATLDERMLRDELRRMRARDEARRILDAERRGPLPEFDADTLAAVLARPEEPRSRVEGLIPWEAGTLLTAQRKTGKTTTVLNLARSLLTGEDFLGRFSVRPVLGMVAVLNFEVSAAQLGRWASEVGVPPDRLYLVNVRGRRNPLGHDEDREALAVRLRALGVETVMVDPFGRAYVGKSQNDAGEVGAWLADLDRWARGQVGARDLILTAHAGWNMERTRGSTALEDWADVIITLTRDDAEDGAGDRYLRAVGRDVDLDEDRLLYDADARRLTLAGSGSRAATGNQRRAEDLAAAVLSVVAGQAGLSGAQVERQLRDAGVSFQKGQERRALGALVATGQLIAEPGSRGAKLYRIGPPSPPSPTLPAGAPGDPPHPPYIGGGSPNAAQTEPPSPLSCLVCGQPMTLIEPGQTTHPGCEAA